MCLVSAYCQVLYIRLLLLLLMLPSRQVCCLQSIISHMLVPDYHKGSTAEHIICVLVPMHVKYILLPMHVT